MVVNQDLGPGVGEKKVQCILVSKEASKCAEHLKQLVDVSEDAKLKQLTMVSPGINGRTPRVSSRLRLCERYEHSPFQQIEVILAIVNFTQMLDLSKNSPY